uniref:Uncharacterized protein n=1 Tax=Timema poppense TaxID=170557 RepID=A0A7R9CQ30_TIMPO|nr:unnamed protein product [Timema poppensis]
MRRSMRGVGADVPPEGRRRPAPTRLLPQAGLVSDNLSLTGVERENRLINGLTRRHVGSNGCPVQVRASDEG